MTLLKKQNYKWIIVLSFLGIIFVPGMLPSPTFKTPVLVVFGGICLICELLYLRSLDAKTENFKSDFRQTLALILFTIILLVVNFVL